jgi:hypothetical protein
LATMFVAFLLFGNTATWIYEQDELSSSCTGTRSFLFSFPF